MILPSSPFALKHHSQALNVSYGTPKRVLVDDLIKYSYRIQTTQKLSEADKIKSKKMAEKLLTKMEENARFLNLLWTSDKVQFEENVNTKNKVFWRSKKPIEVAERPLYSGK